MHIEDELKQLVNCLEMATVRPLYYFAHKWELKNAIEFLADSDVIVVDLKGNMWQRGKKLKEIYNDNQ